MFYVSVVLGLRTKVHVCESNALFEFQLESGRVALEGVMSEEYYKVRELLYNQFAIV